VLKLKQECTLAADEIPDHCGEWLKEAFLQANASLKERNRERGSNMGTTLLAAVVAGYEAHIASVGDSRAYLLMPTGMQQITTDHTMTQTLVESGALQPEEAENHPYENVLTRAIGLEKELDVDLFTVEIMPGDALLLCSDGLYKQLDDETIQEIVREAESAQDACEALVDAANDAGGRDNVAVVLVRVKEEYPV
jgi:protein phosphatase